MEQVLWRDAPVDWRAFDAVLVRSCWDYHLYVDEFAAWVDRLEASGVKVVNSPAVIRWNLRKSYLAELCAAGVTIPDSVWVDDSIDVARVCAERGWTSAVVKPLVSASAHGTSVRHDGEVRGPVIVQEFLNEIHDGGEWSLMHFGGQYSHAVVKRPADGDFRVQMEYGGSAVADDPPVEIRDFAARALAAAPGPTAFARVDVVVSRRRGPVLMELELIEPELFLDSSAGASDRLAAAILES